MGNSEEYLTLYDEFEREAVTIHPFDKICQCLFLPIVHPLISEVDDFETETKRAEGGFGSTGVHYN